jgi:hypothetical protein
MLVTIAIPIVLAAFPLFFEKYLVFYNGPIFLIIRSIITVPLIALWIYTINIWAKNDRNVPRLFAVVFFLGLYTPFYFRKAIKNKWI